MDHRSFLRCGELKVHISSQEWPGRGGMGQGHKRLTTMKLDPSTK